MDQNLRNEKKSARQGDRAGEQIIKKEWKQEQFYSLKI
jgi:hypothetical protein